MNRLLWLAGILAIVLIGVAAGLRVTGHDPAVWHVDPTQTERTGRDNDFLAAPAGTTVAETDEVLAPKAIAPRDLLFLFDSIARNAPRTKVIGGSVEDLHITYMQRSPLFAFPDYVSVKAVESAEGAALVIWSRSRFGYSDLGVNRERIEGWLAAMGPQG